MTLKFGKYWEGEWEHSMESGVGMELIGYPTDIYAFFDLLHSEACNPAAARKILEELEQNGIKRTTVRPTLNFELIGDTLATLGVIMNILPPAKEFNDTYIYSVIFSLYNGKYVNIDEFSKEDQLFIRKQLIKFEESMLNIPHDFGPYKSRTQEEYDKAQNKFTKKDLKT